MSLLGFSAQNHPQQVRTRGANSRVDDRETPAALFRQIESQHGPFTLDAAASSGNTKCDRFFSIEENGLVRSWAGESVWCNPPYSNIRPWIEKAWSECRVTEVIAMLLPANRLEQAYWHDLVEPYRDRPGSPLVSQFIRDRHRFGRAGQVNTTGDRPPFGLVVLAWKIDGPNITSPSLFDLAESEQTA